jgi:hypothetical protein
MTEKTLEDLLAQDSGSIAAVLHTIATLREELQSGHTTDWENPTLDRYLEALHAWLEAVGTRVEGKLSWKLVEAMFQAAKIYE